MATPFCRAGKKIAEIPASRLQVWRCAHHATRPTPCASPSSPRKLAAPGTVLSHDGDTALIAAAVNPAIGLGTYFAQLLLSESINAAATQVLHISGPWNKPQVDTLKGEVASETARRILLSHATPGPVGFTNTWLSHTSATTLPSQYSAYSPNILRKLMLPADAA